MHMGDLRDTWPCVCSCVRRERERGKGGEERRREKARERELYFHAYIYDNEGVWVEERRKQAEYKKYTKKAVT